MVVIVVVVVKVTDHSKTHGLFKRDLILINVSLGKLLFTSSSLGLAGFKLR